MALPRASLRVDCRLRFFTIARPLVLAWITVVAFTVLNAALLRVRIRAENTALERI